MGINNSKSTPGKIALVTGASRGLGQSIALDLAKAGMDVVVTDLLIENEPVDVDQLSKYSVLSAHFAATNQIRTLSLVEEIRQMGRRSLGLKMDVTCPDEVQNVVAQIKRDLGEIEILVNNAGVMDNFALMENQSVEMWERDLKVNLSGAFHCIQAVWMQMKKRQWGRIINISSFTASSGAFGQPGYGATKAGLVGLTRTMALEGARFGITVNAVLPGFIETEALKLHDQNHIKRITERIAMKRLGKPEEISSLVAFLASEASGYVTGAAIPVTGGADLFVF